LGEEYHYFVKRVPVTVVDSMGLSESKRLPVTVVQNWDDSTFVAVNPARQCLLGRDLFREFALELVLLNLA
jgi:hypothetical protein